MKRMSESLDTNYIQDNGYGCRVYPSRLEFYYKLGLKDSQIEKWCDKFGYEPYIKHVLFCKSDYELYQKHYESWKYVRDTLSSKHDRRGGRTCFATSKDILMDGLITDILIGSINHYYPDLDISKNDNDKQLSLNSNAELTPDFKVVMNGKLYYVEMKITKEKKDGSERSDWSRNTLTVRPGKYNSVNKEIFRYKKFNNKYHPVMFLRINYTGGMFAVIAYDKFKPSSKDDTYFAYYRQCFFNKLEDLTSGIVNEIKNEIESIEK